MSNSTDTPKRFDDWYEVDCNECARYWDSSCDGVKTSIKGSKMPCNSFLATRSVIIPKEIERLKRAIKLILGLFGFSLVLIGILFLMIIL
jgi:hypothetical protein